MKRLLQERILQRKRLRVGRIPVDMTHLLEYRKLCGDPNFHSVTPQDVIEYISQKEREAKSNFPEYELTFEVDLCEGYDPGLNFTIHRMETDAEYNNRVKQNDIREAAEAERVARGKINREAQEIKKYKELRAKYGDTV